MGAVFLSEINRLYSTAEYNGIKFFELANNAVTAQAGAQARAQARAVNNMPIAKAEYNGFIENPVSKEQSYVDALDSVSSVSQATGFTKSEYKVGTVDDLVKLAELTNAGFA